MEKQVRVKESYEDFNYRFTLAQQLSQESKAVIFIGNSRVGKTTLACAAAGSQIEIIYSGNEGMTFMEPTEAAYKKLVRNTASSVTEIPNLFSPAKDKNKNAIVDLPGFSDSSRFRELINFYYIQTMIKNIKEIRFVIVINIHVKDKGQFEIDGNDLKMMQAFSLMFPDCQSVVSLIVNRLEHNGAKDLKSLIIQYLSLILRDTAFMSKHVNYPQKMKKYYQTILGNVLIIQKPLYRKSSDGKADWRQKSKDIKKTMIDFCNNQGAKFILVDKLKTKISIFREDDVSSSKENFMNALKSILKKMKDSVIKGANLYKKTLEIAIKGVIQGKNEQRQLAAEYKGFLQGFESIPSKARFIDQDKLQLLQSKLLNIFWLFARVKNEYPIDQLQKDLMEYSSKLLFILKQQFKPDLRESFIKYSVITQRLMQQISFLYKVFQKEDKSTQANQILQQIKEVIEQFRGYCIMGEQDQLFVNLFPKLVQVFVFMNIQELIGGKTITLELKRQLIEGLDRCKQKLYSSSHGSGKLTDEIKKKIDRKIEEVQIFYLMKTPILPNENQKIKNIIKELLKKYGEVENKETKFKIALKVAKLHEKKQPKKAIGLFFHLQKHDQVFDLLNVITSPQQSRAVQWYSEFADEYLKKKKYHLFEKCIEKAKRYEEDNIEKLVILEKSLYNGAKLFSQEFHLNNGKILCKETLAEQLEYWNWDRIGDQINFLRQKKGIKVIARQLRQKK